VDNALTVDVEDYFHVTAFEKSIGRGDWDRHPLRVEANTQRILDLFAEHGVQATFFVLGWVAERLPRLVQRIQERGHEVACHGYGHERIYAIGPENFRKDVRRSKQLLEQICGRAVLGYRAPSFSITERSLWALDILIEEGFAYDSSIFPIYHDVYGMRGVDRHPHLIRRDAGTINEFPMSTFVVGAKGLSYTFPVSGGGYLRFFPLWFIRRAIASINTRDRRPAVLYFHPWEIDPGQPRVRAGLKSRFRHYHNLGKTYGKVGELLSTFSFAPMGSVLGVR
jgi:polysaccharide deacetylase family protein (PEP-CTERM system associated)